MAEQEKYTESFARTQALRDGETYKLLGDTLIVRLINEEPKTASGIYIPSQEHQIANTVRKRLPLVAEVLEVGEGTVVREEGDDGEEREIVPAPLVERGNVVELEHDNGVTSYSYYPGLDDTQGQIGRTTEKHIVRIFKNLEAYERYKQLLAGQAEGEVGL